MKTKEEIKKYKLEAIKRITYSKLNENNNNIIINTCNYILDLPCENFDVNSAIKHLNEVSDGWEGTQ